MQILGNLAVKFGCRGNINVDVHSRQLQSVPINFLGKVAKFGSRNLNELFLGEGGLKSPTA